MLSDEAIAYDELEARLTAIVSERMVALAALTGGEHVLDVACGTGEPAIRLARAVGPAGRVLGVDLSTDRLALAARRAAGLPNVEWRRLDAVDVGSTGEMFDVVTSRWGLMYVAEPARTLAAIRGVLRPGGRLVAALWAEPERVSWATVPRRVTARFAPLPAPDPERPGAFRFADLARVERDFAAAGLRVEHVEEHDVDVVIADSGRGIARWVQVVLGTLLNGVEDLPAWEAAMAAEADALGCRLGGVTRLVVAR